MFDNKTLNLNTYRQGTVTEYDIHSVVGRGGYSFDTVATKLKAAVEAAHHADKGFTCPNFYMRQYVRISGLPLCDLAVFFAALPGIRELRFTFGSEDKG